MRPLTGRVPVAVGCPCSYPRSDYRVGELRRRGVALHDGRARALVDGLDAWLGDRPLLVKGFTV